MSLISIVQRGWESVGAKEFDQLVNDYTEDMRFIMPGQSNTVDGKRAFRLALDSIDNAFPPGFKITGLRHLQGGSEVISIVEWQSDKVDSSQLTVLFKFIDEKIYEERWFIDTYQWKGAF